MNRIFALLTLAALLAGCSTVSEKDRQAARVHLDLAQSTAKTDPRAALAEVEKSLARNPEDPEAYNVHGLLLHYFERVDAAEAAYRKALELDPDFSQVKVNFSGLLIAEDRCAEAVPLLREVLGDLHFREPYLAENNLGWCAWKLGDAETALRHLGRAIRANPNFCLGFRNLAEIHEARSELKQALRYADRYADSCPEEADAHFRLGVLQLKSGDDEGARASFSTCREKARVESLAEECATQAELIPGA